MIFLISWFALGAVGVWLMVRDWVMTVGQIDVTYRTLLMWAVGVVVLGPIVLTTGCLITVNRWADHRPPRKPLFVIRSRRVAKEMGR